jgi:O-antigen biosynthesis protein
VPRFSIVTPVHDPPEPVLRAMLASVRAQAFGDWEHCLVDDGSTAPHVRAVLDEAAAADPRLRVRHRAANGGIVAASNDALALATGEFVVLLDNDDELHPDALRRADEALAATPEADVLYTDEDRIDEAGRHASPFFKPDWSPERLRTQMYTGHMSVLRTALVREVGGFHEGADGAQDWDLVFRVTERARAVVHVPEVLYHWRTLPGSTAGEGAAAKPWAYDAATRVIQAHCDRTGIPAVVERDATYDGVYHLSPRLDEHPLVSIVVPTAGRSREIGPDLVRLVTQAAASIVERTTYPAYELVVVVDGTVEANAELVDELRTIAGDRLVVVPFTRPFNFSQKCNVGVLASRGEYVLLLNDDIEVVTPSWLERLVMYARLPGMGAVGAKLLFGDGRLQHVGLTFGGPMPAHVYRGYPGDHEGYFCTTLLACNYVAVTGACLLTPRAVFDEAGGLSPRLPLNFNDVDYCLKLRSLGYRVAYDPDTVLVHYEASSRSLAVSDAEREFLLDRWGLVPGHDPYVNPHFNRSSVDFVPPVYLSDGSVA